MHQHLNGLVFTVHHRPIRNKIHLKLNKNHDIVIELHCKYSQFCLAFLSLNTYNITLTKKKSLTKSQIS